MRTLVLATADGRGSIRPLTAPPDAPVWAVVDERSNALAPDAPAPAFTPGGRHVLWSGWTPRSPEVAPEPALTWGRAMHAAFESWCDGVAPELARARATLLFRPHASHILSDVPSCLSFLRRGQERSASGFGLLLDPCGMLDASMLRRADDHLDRTLSALASHAAVEAVLLTNVQPVPDRPDELRPAPLHRGLVPPSVITAAYRAHAAAIPALVLLDEAPEEQLALLGVP